MRSSFSANARTHKNCWERKLAKKIFLMEFFYESINHNKFMIPFKEVWKYLSAASAALFCFGLMPRMTWATMMMAANCAFHDSDCECVRRRLWRAVFQIKFVGKSQSVSTEERRRAKWTGMAKEGHKNGKKGIAQCNTTSCCQAYVCAIELHTYTQI